MIPILGSRNPIEAIAELANNRFRMSVAGETDEGGLQLVSDKSVQRIKEKTEIALVQKQFVDELVDFRVKMQNLLVLVNRLPQVLCFRYYLRNRELFETSL